MRAVLKRYEDPLTQVWRGCARKLGIKITRSSEVFASYDGNGTLTLGAEDTLDADDCVAQMVLHELCHWLVQGDDAHHQPDWGLDNMSEQDLKREHACVVTQALVLMPHGLGHVLAPTTEHRAFYDEFYETLDAPGDVNKTADLADSNLVEAGFLSGRLNLDPFVEALVTTAIERSKAPTWKPLHDALSASAQIVRATAAYADEDSLLR